MTLKKEQIPYLILGFCGLFTIVMGIFIFLYPPGIFPDPSWGFQVMRSMEHGGPFNYLVGPSQDDLMKNTPQFLTWWSPGQYLAPYFFKSLLNLNIGQAAALTTTFCQLTGLCGLFVFFRRIGFSLLISSVSLLLIVTQEFYNIPFVFYNGGEILVFAFAGWYLYGCTTIKNTGFYLLIYVFLAGLIGFFCKSSLMWVYAAGLAYLWIRLSDQKAWIYWLKNGVVIGLPAILALFCISHFFLSKGANPASASEGIRITWTVFTFPLSAPLLSGFSIDELFRGLIFHQDKPLVGPAASLIILILLAILSLLLVIGIIKTAVPDHYKMLVIVFYAVAFLFFSFVFLKQSTISYEGRHLRVLGLVIIPGAVCFFAKQKRAFITLLMISWLGISLNSILYLSHGYVFNKVHGVRGNTGLAQEFIDQPSLNAVIKLDNQYNNAIFAFISPDLGLEIKHNRIITLAPIGNDLQLDYDEFLHNGHAGPIFIVLPKSYAGTKAEIVFKCFPGYKNFSAKDLSTAYTLYSAF